MLINIRTCLAVALISTAFTACKHDNLEVPDVNKTFRNAGDFVRNNYDLTMFAAAVERAGIREELNGEGPFTLLAPNNSAFAELGITRASDFDKLNADSLRNVLHYHMLGRRLLMTDLPANSLDSRYASLYNGHEPYFTYVAYGTAGPGFPSNRMYINGSYAVKSNVALANGTLHVMDKVMKYTPGTVQDWLSARAEYSVFVAALKKFGQWDQLAAEGTRTVFAPDNAALEEAGITAEWVHNADPDAYVGARLFGIYILPGRRFFITDFAAAGELYGNASFSGFIANDTWKFALSGTKDTYRLLPASYSFAFVEPATEARPWDQSVRGIESDISGRNDNLTDNGIVHYLPQVVVLPDEAKK